jgi:DNA polymerase III alpha subunit/intein/homing endonuclease
MTENFVHLHVHSEHSLLDGFGHIDDLCAKAAELGQPGIAVTDHGTLTAAYELVKSAKKYDITPIVGIEAYVTPGDTPHTLHEPVFFGSGDRDNKEERSNDVSGGGAYTHMTMLAENNVGMHNIFRLNSIAFKEGQYKKPRMSVDLISQYSEGIIATTGCPSGELQTRLRLGQWDKAVEYAARMQDIFGKDNYFLELMDHEMSIDLERKVRGQLLEVAKKLNIPLLATNDLHYVNRGDALSHEHMLAIQSGSTMQDLPYDRGGKRFAFEGEEYYLKSAEEMARYFGNEQDYPGAMSNTVLIAERCNVSFAEDTTLRPTVPLPAGHDEHTYLREVTYAGHARKNPDKVNDKEYIDRIEMELNVLKTKNFSGYMLVVAEFVNWAKDQKWQVGPGRGCLSADSNILTPTGFKKIKDIRVGDTVFDQNGEQVTVPEVFEYDCDEELVSINTFYGNEPIKMTSDHKVLVSKANREITKKQKAQGYAYGKSKNELKWMRADEVEVGDFVVMPKIKFANALKKFIIDPVSVRQTNEEMAHSTRGISKALGMDRRKVSKFINGDLDSLSQKSIEKLQNYFDEYSVSAEDLINSRKVTEILSVGAEISADFNLGKLFGIFISNGWLRTKSSELGFAQRRTEDEGVIPDLITKVFGAKTTVTDSTTTDLRQYRIQHKGIVGLFEEVFPDYNHTAHTKYIPTELLNSSEEFRTGLLEGLWHGDGTHKGKTHYSTVSERLAQNVLSLLVSLGLPAGLRKTLRTETRPEFRPHSSNEYHEYLVTNARYFDLSKVHNGYGAAYDGEFTYYRVSDIETVPAEGKVYDFTVPTTSSYVTDSFVVHNSGGGSYVGYAIDITDIDPIPHGLIFERFLNPERPSAPDYDMDFDDINRPEVIQHVRDLYGEETIAMIVTFGKIKAKNALKDISRIFDEPYATGEILTKALPPDVQGKGITLSDAYNHDSPRYNEAAAFREAVTENGKENILQAAQGIEGRIRSTGVHAAGVIMSSKPLIDVIPLQTRKEDGITITQFDYPTCEDLGLIKMDFLGIRNLTVIDKTVKSIERNHGVKIDMQDLYKNVLTKEDPKTYKLLQDGRTLGVFQLDSPAITSLVKSIRPTKFGDLSAAIALYRPGPMGMNSHNIYANRKNGREPVVPIHPELEEALADIVDETYGVIAYQEQVMAIAQKIAGYSLGSADNLRRIMGKKKAYELEKEYPVFHDGMVANGYSEDAIKKIWETLIPFAEYGFNKSHSAAYGLISYATAYLKANYPAEFMAGNLSTLTDDKDKTALYLEECRHIGLKVASPSVSYSQADYTPTTGSEILVGLEAIRGVGREVAEAIAAEATANGPFKTIEDFLDRAPAHALSKGVIEGLALSGALDGFGYSRRALNEYLPDIAKDALKQKKKEDLGQFSLFEDLDDVELNLDIPDVPEYVKKDKLSFERHYLGLYVSDHPLSGIANTLDRYSDTKIIDIITGQVKAGDSFADRKKITLAGVANSVVKKPTKAGAMMGRFSFEDITGSIPAMIFPKAFERLGPKLFSDNIYTIKGSLMQRDPEDEITFAVDSIDEIELTDDGRIPFVIRLWEHQVNNESMTELAAILKENPGDSPVYIHINKSDGIQVMELPKEFSISMEAFNKTSIRRQIMELFGVDSVVS